jgi:hypothetical protein
MTLMLGLPLALPDCIATYGVFRDLLKLNLKMTLDELEREYVPLRQQALAVRSYL